ncbi:hypothetical protein [Spartinivicinus ruber]|uniref:hypothetical protein n=1 Tax=Spartinivicinus ruber TaxID=2683272 RepID=UPI0013D1436E|nr:hypothetical protein [Spartinivicinus ruber]
MNMKHYKLSPTRGQDYEFRGAVIATTEYTNNGMTAGVDLYKTESGKFIFHLESQDKPGEEPVHYVEVYNNEDALIGEYGYNEITKPLYKQAGIGKTIVV